MHICKATPKAKAKAKAKGKAKAKSQPQPTAAAKSEPKPNAAVPTLPKVGEKIVYKGCPVRSLAAPGTQSERAIRNAFIYIY